MTLPIDTLIRGYTRDEAFEVALQALEDLKIPARSWREGGTFKSIVGVFATVGSIASNIVAGGIRGNFLDWAEGAWLTLFAALTFDVARIPATFAAGQVTLTNQGGGVYSWGADELVVVNTATGARYRVTGPGNLAAFATLTVDVMAVEAGAAGSSAPGTIDRLETTLARVVVGNADPLIGADEELDEPLRTRCRAKRGTRSANGPRGAWEFAALSATFADGTATSINRCVRLPSAGTGAVTVVVATPSGAPTPLELAAVRASVERWARTDTDSAFVEPAVEVAYNRTITIWRRDGDEATVRANAEKALRDLQATYPIGGISKGLGLPGHLWADALESAVIASSPGVVFDVDQDGGDIELAYNEIPILSATLLVRTGR